MNTSLVPRSAAGAPANHTEPGSAAGRFLGVVARPHSYRSIGYLLLGLPMGTLWFAVLVSVLSVGVSMLVVALIGIPILYGTWFVIRAFTNVERSVADVLLDQDIPLAPLAATPRGNVWVRLRSMTAEPDRRRELAFLVLRFPAGVATFVAAVTALTAPVVVAYAPVAARYVDEPFGEWFWSSELEDAASASPWSWGLVPLGVLMLVCSFHLMNALADACGRWAAGWLADTTEAASG
jgi:hypothetical protein